MLVYGNIGGCEKGPKSSERYKLYTAGYPYRLIPSELIPVARWCYDVYFESNLPINASFKDRLKAILRALYKLLRKLTTFLSSRGSNSSSSTKYLSKFATFATAWNTFNCVNAWGSGWEIVGCAFKFPRESYRLLVPSVSAPVVEAKSDSSDSSDAPG